MCFVRALCWHNRYTKCARLSDISRQIMRCAVRHVFSSWHLLYSFISLQWVWLFQSLSHQIMAEFEQTLRESNIESDHTEVCDCWIGLISHVHSLLFRPWISKCGTSLDRCHRQSYFVNLKLTHNICWYSKDSGLCSIVHVRRDASISVSLTVCTGNIMFNNSYVI